MAAPSFLSTSIPAARRKWSLVSQRRITSPPSLAQERQARYSAAQILSYPVDMCSACLSPAGTPGKGNVLRAEGWNPILQKKTRPNRLQPALISNWRERYKWSRHSKLQVSLLHTCISNNVNYLRCYVYLTQRCPESS